jgi:predicted transcriptional regulator
VAKSTMSEWLTEWERDGLVPARTQQGRCKALAN